MPDLILKGCTPFPLSSYLKSLGVLRIVTQQADDAARGYWNGTQFVLRTRLDTEDILGFFVDRYVPSPIVVPWSGNDFFGVRSHIPSEEFTKKFKEAPTSSKAIEAVCVSVSPRLATYRRSIQDVLSAMRAARITSKADIEGSGTKQKSNKARLLLALRSLTGDEIAEWLDTTTTLTQDGFHFNNLLGSGGGSDGNSHFSDNFMQALWYVLADFDSQRASPPRATGGLAFDSRRALQAALLGTLSPATKISKLSPVLFDPTSVGGANSTTGFDDDASSNPWDFILMLEGTFLFSGSLSRKMGTSNSFAAFPFLLGATPVGQGGLVDKEAEGKELWLPLWQSPTGLNEITNLFSEGRIQVGNRMAAKGLDAMQGICRLGSDRGIANFQRVGLFKGRIGGDNYFSSVDAGMLPVQRRQEVDLLSELDQWLIRFRGKASTEKAPESIKRALHRLEKRILTICQYGGSKNLLTLLIELGQTQHALSRSLKWVQKDEIKIKPIANLPPQWISDTDDQSPEFRLASSLASICTPKIGALRRNLEPVDDYKFLESRDRQVVWGERDLVDNLIAVAQRRMLDATLTNLSSFPGKGRITASLGDIQLFIEGQTDDQRIEELLWGLVLIDWSKVEQRPIGRGPFEPRPAAAFSLLKLCHHAGPIQEKSIPLIPEILRRAAAGDMVGATQAASRRLRASGVVPATKSVHVPPEVARRMAAATLFPISNRDIDRLITTITCKEETHEPQHA